MLRSSNKGFLKNIITNRHTAADIGVSNLLSQEKEEDRLQNGPLQSIETPDYPRNDSRIPAATAEPTTPATFGPMACISRKLLGLASWPIGLRHAGCHRNGRNAGGADQRVHLVALREEEVHKLGKQHASGGTQSRTQCTPSTRILKRLDIDERFGGSRSADGKAEEDHHDIHQLVLHGLAQTIHHAALLHQVTQHKTADQRSGARQQQRDDYGDDDREEDLLGFRNRAQLRHLDFTLFLGGQQTHDGRLDHRHEGHVGVGGHGDRAQQFGREASR